MKKLIYMLLVIILLTNSIDGTWASTTENINRLKVKENEADQEKRVERLSRQGRGERD